MGELRIDPVKLRKIGRFDVPEEASFLAGVAEDLNEGLGSLDSMTALAGDPKALRTMLRVGSDVYEEMRETVNDLNNIAVALVMTADDFSGTDEEAAQKYKGMTPTPLPPNIKDRQDEGAHTEEGEHIESTPTAIDPDEYGGAR